MRVAVVQAVTGGRGVGKTQAAAAYARDRAAAGWPLVAWVTAETRDQLLTGLANVAVAVDVADADGDSAVSARNVRRYLEKCSGPALVVFDNATDVDGLAALLPTVGAAQVVITSTDRAFTQLGVTVDMGLFTPEQSVAYLTERTGLADADAAAAVAAELGYLPLALAQAATVISQQSLDYATYQRRLYQAPAAKYLTRHAGDPYPRGAVEAIALAIHSVEDQDDSGLTRAIMGLLSVLSAEGVGRSILASLADAPITVPAIASPHISDEAVDQALGRLVGGSILTRSETGQAFRMHRLVSRVVRERDEADGRLLSTLRVAVDLLQGLQVPHQDGWLRREAGSELVEQVSAVWAASRGRATADDPQFREVTEQLISLRNWSVGQLTVAADLSRAISLGVTVVADCERLLGPDHPDTLTSRGDLAGAYESAGRLGEAIALLVRNLADRERLLGPDHPDTLTSRNNLAGAYRWAGRRRKAIALHERNLTDRERLLGPDHPDTLASRHNLALAYESAGRLGEAIALLERSLADCQRLLGPDHPDTLISRNNLAGAYRWAGRLRRAFSLRRLNAAEARRVLEVGHPDRRRYRRRFWWYLPLPVIFAMLALGTVWSMWTGNYYGAIFVLLCLALVVPAALAFRVFQRFLAARDWRFLSSPWYEHLRARFHHMG
jgi:tetratricopeptide (TPR) repeat protein